MYYHVFIEILNTFYDGKNYDDRERESADQEFDQEELVQVWAGLHQSSISEWKAGGGLGWCSSPHSRQKNLVSANLP